MWGILDSIWDTYVIYYHLELVQLQELETTTTASILKADAEPYAELHSSEVTSVPWLCTDIHTLIDVYVNVHIFIIIHVLNHHLNSA